MAVSQVTPMLRELSATFDAITTRLNKSPTTAESSGFPALQIAFHIVQRRKRSALSFSVALGVIEMICSGGMMASCGFPCGHVFTSLQKHLSVAARRYSGQTHPGDRTER